MRLEGRNGSKIRFTLIKNTGTVKVWVLYQSIVSQKINHTGTHEETIGLLTFIDIVCHFVSVDPTHTPPLMNAHAQAAQLFAPQLMTIIPTNGRQNSFGMLSSSSKNLATSSEVLSLSIIKRSLREKSLKEKRKRDVLVVAAELHGVNVV